MAKNTSEGQQNNNAKSQEVDLYKAKTERLKAYAQITAQIIKAVCLIIFI